MSTREAQHGSKRGPRGFTPIELLVVTENPEGFRRAVGSYPVRGKGASGGLAETKTMGLQRRKGLTMDATRPRRTRDRIRQAWYARCRQQRFARFLGFAQGAAGQAAAPVGRAAREYRNK